MNHLREIKEDSGNYSKDREETQRNIQDSNQNCHSLRRDYKCANRDLQNLRAEASLLRAQRDRFSAWQVLTVLWWLWRRIVKTCWSSSMNSWSWRSVSLRTESDPSSNQAQIGWIIFFPSNLQLFSHKMGRGRGHNWSFYSQPYSHNRVSFLPFSMFRV